MKFTGKSLRTAQWIIAVRDRELPYRDVRSRGAKIEVRQEFPLPRTVVQTWIDNKVGRSHLLEIERLRENNPAFNFLLFTNDDQYDFMRSEFPGENITKIFEFAENGVLRADIFRYCYLYKRGGIYLDFSKYLSSPLESFVRLNSPFVLSYERNSIPEYLLASSPPIKDLKPQLFVQWCLMSASGHRFLDRMILNICREAHQYSGLRVPNVKEALLAFTGSHMWTRSVRDELVDQDREDYVLVEDDYKEEKFPLILGSYARYLFKKHYSHETNRIILQLPED